MDEVISKNVIKHCSLGLTPLTNGARGLNWFFFLIGRGGELNRFGGGLTPPANGPRGLNWFFFKFKQNLNKNIKYSHYNRTNRLELTRFEFYILDWTWILCTRVLCIVFVNFITLLDSIFFNSFKTNSTRLEFYIP